MSVVKVHQSQSVPARSHSASLSTYVCNSTFCDSHRVAGDERRVREKKKENLLEHRKALFTGWSSAVCCYRNTLKRWNHNTDSYPKHLSSRVYGSIFVCENASYSPFSALSSGCGACHPAVEQQRPTALPACVCVSSWSSVIPYRCPPAPAESRCQTGKQPGRQEQ